MRRISSTRPTKRLSGNPNGKITLVEFLDYNCSHCRHMVNDLDRVVKANPDPRIVLAANYSKLLCIDGMCPKCRSP
jgi:protein-disulfide isomerase